MPAMDAVVANELSKPYPPSVRLVEVKIRDLGEVKKLDAGDASLRRGDRVILEAEGDVTYGVVYSEPTPASFIPPMRMMKRILRKAEGDDLALIGRLERLAREASAYCRVKAAELKLRMKLVEVFASLQRRQLTVVYTADERIDFRGLVRDLARRFGGRIEMRQVGVREEARRLGGIDTCGLVLCCASFLTDVKPVTAKQARGLGLQVDDPGLLGVCGRLKCCLMFEMMDAPGAAAPVPALITPVKTVPSDLRPSAS